MLKIFFIAIFVVNSALYVDSQTEAAKSPFEGPSFAHISLPKASSDPTNEGTSRIINGYSATLGQFPSYIFLQLKDSQNLTHLCGGSLIKRNWILTAAHCLVNITSGIAVAGVTNLTSGVFGWKGMFNQSQMFPHAGFTNEQYIDNDIALIKLSSEIPCHKNINVVDLPCYCDGHYDLAGTEATIMGFGVQNFTLFSISKTLQFATTEIMENCECKKFFRFPIFHSHICTNTSSGSSTCFGDSGAGMIADVGARKVLVGIVSFGNKNCLTGNEHPNMYTRVSSYIDWVNGIMESN